MPDSVNDLNPIQNDEEFFIHPFTYPSYTTVIVALSPAEHRILSHGFCTPEIQHQLEQAVTESFMSKIFQSMALSVLALVGLAGCDYESHAAGAANPASVAEMKQSHRDLWLGHIYWVQHAVLDSVKSSPEERDAVKKEVDANTKQIASMLTPFYGEARSQKFLSLLNINIDAVREYSEEPPLRRIRVGRMPRWPA